MQAAFPFCNISDAQPHAKDAAMQNPMDITKKCETRMPAAKNIASQRSGKCENFVEEMFNKVYEKSAMLDQNFVHHSGTFFFTQARLVWHLTLFESCVLKQTENP